MANLSKSKYITYCQCPKALWLKQYKSEEMVIDPFRAGYYYMPAMNGSFSIKKVFPVLFPDDSELDYHNLSGGVQNGGEAMSIYPQIQFMEPEKQKKARRALLDYCCLDTLAMVKLWEKLREVSEE